MQERALKLMKEWCDTLPSYQVEPASSYLDGVLFCARRDSDYFVLKRVKT